MKSAIRLSYLPLLALTVLNFGCFSESPSTVATDGKEVANINGTVLEAGWDEPAVGATVTIDGREIVTTTDMYGSFELKGVPVGEHQLIARYMNQADTLTLVVNEGENAASFKLRL